MNNDITTLNFESALVEAKEWSLDEHNNIGEAVVCQSYHESKTGSFSVCSDGPEEWVVAKFIEGKRIK